MSKQLEGPILPFLRIDATIALPKFRQVQDQLRMAILKGHLRAGTRLPASRILADELGLSRQTLVRVLENLKAEGYLEARQGAGTFVSAALPRQSTKLSMPARGDVTDSAPPRLSRIGEQSRRMSADIGQMEDRPFLPNRPALDRFPFAIWRKCWNAVARSGKAVAMGYGDVAGELVLRQRIAEYLALHRRDPCDPEQIVITPGGHAAFSLAALALADAGDGIWFEDPGPITTSNLFRTLGLRLCPTHVDAEGLDVEGAIARYPDARLAFVMPSRHHPLGVTLTLPRRLALLEWARANDAWIIEDDYDSEFRYDGAPLPSMRSIDSNGRVIYAGSFSKALYPGLRVGYLVLPPPLIGTFRNLSALIHRSVPVETQLALAEFIGGGHFASHLRRMRSLYAERRETFTQVAQETLAGLARIDSSESGLNALAWLKGGRQDQAPHRAVLDAGLQCYPLSDYTIATPLPGALILGYAGVPADRMRPLLLRLADAIARTEGNIGR
ncbi:PLP-dependent aminotransferase family protein [Ensifer adhaerens]|uniref:MocR-like pyridoxine biosynthesis transcription factor PdxR n=1 Tax=Ensifer adhaerens TaxID=106592 RepID=UPI001CBF3CBC|nr:PLP-dependent aminotransferase family protein [Ensifer adhaerens]MBZ7926124.1 PLP-dependent aminotransferase family protein [Ensifer adhaerens]UAX97502.1 PLP-dependent aminotransferase family protein [Ensifer adhaerens]UAY03379.1 PLP-dependent aminotransferase family protein [Ensifer adhaerens]UAY11363.1 PLP-dependent aminotransferase family protein [Ensifer adhaerens]